MLSFHIFTAYKYGFYWNLIANAYIIQFSWKIFPSLIFGRIIRSHRRLEFYTVS